jgi:phage replication O-like protein O
LADSEKLGPQAPFRFNGFRSPNYTQVPDELFDQLLGELSGAELKVLLYVLRRTFGFKKGSDRISRNQLERGISRRDGEVLDRGTGLSRRAIRAALDGLIRKNVLLRQRCQSTEHGHEPSEYALNLLGSESRNHPSDSASRKGSLNGDPWVQSTQGLGYLIPKGLGTLYPHNKQLNNKQFDNTLTLTTSQSSLERRRIEALVGDILDVTGDRRSRNFYLKLAGSLPESLIRTAITDTRDTLRTGQVRTTPGAYFTGCLKFLARTRGVPMP